MAAVIILQDQAMILNDWNAASGRAQEEWKAEVYLEPGEAWALNAGFLLTSVLDVLKNGDTQIAIVDASAACHMPDVLEMPYRPPLFGADETEEKGCTVRLGRTDLPVRRCDRRL